MLVQYYMQNVRFYLKKVKLIDPKTFLDDMNETNFLGHEKQYVDIVMFEYFGPHINTWYSVSTFKYFTYLYQYQLAICIVLIAVKFITTWKWNIHEISKIFIIHFIENMHRSTAFKSYNV